VGLGVALGLFSGEAGLHLGKLPLVIGVEDIDMRIVEVLVRLVSLFKLGGLGVEVGKGFKDFKVYVFKLQVVGKGEGLVQTCLGFFKSRHVGERFTNAKKRISDAIFIANLLKNGEALLMMA